MKLIENKYTTPKKSITSLSVKTDSDADDIFLWLRENAHGTVWWSKINFRDPQTSARIFMSRQKHFTDGYWVTKLWFSRKQDAALFILFWDSIICK